MSENSPSSGIISSNELEELAGLFDRWEFALDPTSDDCKAAEIQFQARVQDLFDAKIRAAYPELNIIRFSCGVKAQARAFLRNKRN
jgi:hypothetical protein